MVTPMQTNFMSSWSFWAGSSIALSIPLVKFAPGYTIRQSYMWTAFAILMLQWMTYGVYTIIIYPHCLSPLRHLPQPTENVSFFSGSWSTLVKEPSGMPARRWINEIPNDGLITYRMLFNQERLLITSPKGLAEVLTTKSYQFIKPTLLQKSLGQLLGVGVLLAEGDDHKIQRKNLAPAFNFRHVKELYPTFWAKSREMVKTILKEELDKKPSNVMVEVNEWASRATLDIIGVAGLGQDFNSLSDPDTELNKVYRSIFNPSRSAQLLGLLQFFLPHIIVRNLPVKRNNDIMAAAKVARDTSRQLVQQKKERMARKEKIHPDIISIALESGGFSDDKLVDNMMTFLAAGHETTASAMTWAAYLLCQKPEVQTRLREEVRSHIKSLDDEIDNTVIDGMPYLHAVCQEVLRLYAPVPLTLRDTATDTTILGQFVPRGTKIILCPSALNCSKELWGDDADQFNPDRWMAPGQANSGGATSNYAFMTFLHGPRSCIGAKFATAELACLLAAFVGRIEFKMTDPDEKIEVKEGITARPRNGMRVNVKVLEGW